MKDFRKKVEQAHDWVIRIEYSLTKKECQNIKKQKGRVGLERTNMRNIEGPICKTCGVLYLEEGNSPCGGEPQAPQLEVVRAGLVVPE